MKKSVKEYLVNIFLIPYDFISHNDPYIKISFNFYLIILIHLKQHFYDLISVIDFLIRRTNLIVSIKQYFDQESNCGFNRMISIRLSLVGFNSITNQIYNFDFYYIGVMNLIGLDFEEIGSMLRGKLMKWKELI